MKKYSNLLSISTAKCQQKLVNCYTDQKAKFVVRTAGAGSGFLACFIDGPSKVALSCHEVDEGYEFQYTPFSPGKYLITVKYGNIGIAGSPYQSVVTGWRLICFVPPPRSFVIFSMY